MSTKLSTLEWEIMEVLWGESPLSASEIHERIPKQHNCHVKTVRSLLDRMQKKEAIHRHKKHGVWIFEPALEREACLLKESRTFLQRFFHAQPVPLIAHLVQNDMLSDEELNELRVLIESHTSGESAREKSHD